MIAKINSIASFDATDGNTHIIRFSWNSLDATITRLKCIIKLRGELVYEKIITYTNSTGVFQFDLIPKEKDTTLPSPYKKDLENGNTYNIWVLGSKTESFDDEITEFNQSYFDCISAPSVKFTNLDGSVMNGEYVFKILYHQEEGRNISNLNIKFKSNIQSNSDIIPVSVNDVSLDSDNNAIISYTVSNVVNSQLYYIRAYGSCVGGVSFDTGSQFFAPVEEGYHDYHFISAVNMAESGGIRISTNIVSANGLLYDENGNLVNTEELNGNTMIPNVLRVGGIENTINLKKHKLVYNRGFILNSDFDFLLVCSNLEQNQEIASFEYLTQDGKVLANPNVTGRLFYREGYNGSNIYHGFFEWEVESKYTDDFGNKSTHKRIYLSNPITDTNWISNKDKMFCGVRIFRDGNYYCLQCIIYD